LPDEEFEEPWLVSLVEQVDRIVNKQSRIIDLDAMTTEDSAFRYASVAHAISGLNRWLQNTP